jgi:hypothetical protein
MLDERAGGSTGFYRDAARGRGYLVSVQALAKSNARDDMTDRLRSGPPIRDEGRPPP